MTDLVHEGRFRFDEAALAELFATTPELRNSAAKQRSFRRILEEADASGRLAVPGGVRGWASFLDCGLSKPQANFTALAELGLIAADIIREPGCASIAELVVLWRPDRSRITQGADEAPTPVAHPDAVDDRSRIDPPLASPHVVHDSPSCGGGGEGAQACETLADQDRPAYQELTALGVAWDEALALAPHADLAQIAYLTASGRRKGADLPAWVVAGIRAGRRPPPRLAERITRRRQEAPPRAGHFDPAAARAEIERLGGVVSAPPAPPRPDPAATSRGEGQARASPRPDQRLSQIWQAALGMLQAQVSRQEFDTWLRGSTLLALDGPVATVGAVSPFHKERLEHRYLTPIRRALDDVLGAPVQLRITAD